MDIHPIVGRKLAAVGLRYTATRRRIVDVLDAAHRPVTIPEILAAATGLAQSSAYRNLTELIDAGIVHRIIGTDDHGRFELAEDLTGDHHHHLICAVCGEVQDFEASNSLEQTLDRSLPQTAARLGFTIHHHRLDLVGTCASCS